MRQPVLIAALLATSAFAQQPAATVRRNEVSPFFGAGPVANSPVLTGAPYSAEGQSQNVQTLADGTHITSPLLTWKFYRDSHGRTRVERPVNGNANDSDRQIIIDITDPVAFVKYTLFPATQEMRTQHMDPLAPPPPPPPAQTATHGEQHLPPEALGKQTFEGVECEGTRTTVVWPVGSAGNDREYSVVREIWKSDELQLVFSDKLTNPRSGNRTQMLTHFSREEPSLDLFQVPPGYKPVGANASAPQLISKVEPQYSEKARKAKLSGSILLSCLVGVDGVPSNIKVLRPLGLGLDEKAIEALLQWRFKPGMKDGHPVPVTAQVEISFRLY